MSDDVVWAANEPKTLTPQEALRALADGKCVKSSRFIYKLVGEEICDFNDGRVPIWSPVTYVYRDGSIIAPDPSQPAEPQVDDKVKRIPGCECHLEVGDSPCRVHGEDEEAEPQVEYPKSSCSCMGDASCPCRRNK